MSFSIDEEFVLRAEPQGARLAATRTTRTSAGSCGGAGSRSSGSPSGRSRFRVAVPSWGVGTGGTRFARFAGPGEPRSVFEKLDDCDVDPRSWCG